MKYTLLVLTFAFVQPVMADQHLQGCLKSLANNPHAVAPKDIHVRHRIGVTYNPDVKYSFYAQPGAERIIKTYRSLPAGDSSFSNQFITEILNENGRMQVGPKDKKFAYQKNRGAKSNNIYTELTYIIKRQLKDLQTKGKKVWEVQFNSQKAKNSFLASCSKVSNNSVKMAMGTIKRNLKSGYKIPDYELMPDREPASSMD